MRVRQGPSTRVRARAGAKIPGAALNDCIDNCRRDCATRWAGAYHLAGAFTVVLIGAALEQCSSVLKPVAHLQEVLRCEVGQGPITALALMSEH